MHKTPVKKRAQAMTEYLIMLLLVAVASIAVSKGLGGVIKRKIKMARDHISKDVTLD